MLLKDGGIGLKISAFGKWKIAGNTVHTGEQTDDERMTAGVWNSWEVFLYDPNVH